MAIRYKLTLLIVLFITVLGYSQSGAKQQAMEFATSAQNGETKTLLKKYHEHVIDDLGGKKKAKSLLEQNYKELKENGLELIEFEILDPVFEWQGQQNAYALLPYYTTLEQGGNKMKIENYLLGVSSDDKEWKFLNTANYPEEIIIQLFPELEDKIEFPDQSFNAIN